MLYNCCEQDGYTSDTDKGMIGSSFFFWLVFLFAYHIYCFLDAPPVFQLMMAAPYWRISFMGWFPLVPLYSFNGNLDDYRNLQDMLNRLPVAFTNPMYQYKG